MSEGLSVEIHKNLGSFKLNIAFESKCRRLGILGASGCGKSLTLKSIAGIEEPDSGRIAVGDRVLFDRQKKISLRPQERRVGYLFQNYALFPNMTVAQNIAVGLRGSKEEKRKRVDEMVEKFQLRGLEGHVPGQLSGGQQQRAALARIMAYEPEMILLDEPFSALDVHLRDKMQRELMEMLKDYPGFVILVSHSRDEIYRMSEEVLILDEGKIVGQGNTKQVFLSPGSVAAAKLTGCKNITAADFTKVDSTATNITAVGSIEAGSIDVKEWGMTLPVHRVPEQKICAIGIRAHEFLVEKNSEKDYITFDVLDAIITEDMFEYQISFRPSEKAVGRVDWKISKREWNPEKQGMPEKIYLDEKDLLLLYK